MSADWPLRKISEVAEFLNYKRVPLKSLDREKRQGIYPYYGASGVVNYIDDYIFDETYLLISEDGENLRTRKTPIAFKAIGKLHLVPTLRVGMQTGAKPVYMCFTKPDHFLSRLINDCRFLVSYAFPRGSVGTRNNGKDRAWRRVVASVRMSHA